MQTCTICGCPSNSLNLNLGSFPTTERLSSVEHILDILIKSRHGTHRFAKKLDLTFGTARDAVPATCLDQHPLPFWMPLAQKVLKFLRDAFSKPTGAASIPACQRLKTAYALTFTQLANSRGP